MGHSNEMENSIFGSESEVKKDFEKRYNDILDDPVQLMSDESLWENNPDAKAKLYYGIFYEYIHKIWH